MEKVQWDVSQGCGCREVGSWLGSVGKGRVCTVVVINSMSRSVPATGMFLSAKQISEFSHTSYNKMGICQRRFAWTRSS